MTTPFGFSVGDFVAVISLVWKICQALREASGDVRMFSGLLIELAAFNEIVVQLQNSMGTISSMPQDQRSTLQRTLQQARTTVEDFDRYVDTFRASFTTGIKTQSITSWRKRVLWSLSGVKKIKGFRESMQSYSAILNLALLSLNTHAVQNLDQRLGEEAKSLSLQMQQHAADMNLQISSSLEDPWDQKPIRFQDAMGRRYPVPLEVCRTLGGLLDFFKHAFKGTPMNNAIEQFSIWLFTPVPGKAKNWNLITAEDWETCARPGMQLGMSLATALIDDGSGPKGAFSFKTQAKVGFHPPLPPWAPYPEDAHFEYLPYKKVPSFVEFLPLTKVDHPLVTLAACSSCPIRSTKLFEPASLPAESAQPEHPIHSTLITASPKLPMQLEFGPDSNPDSEPELQPVPAPAPPLESDSLRELERLLSEEVETPQWFWCIWCGMSTTQPACKFCIEDFQRLARCKKSECMRDE